MNAFAAPAKINWFLHLNGRRADGYHRLQSAMQLIDLQDTLHIELTASGHFTREGAPELGERDLCVRAAELFYSASRSSGGCHIRLEKRIPSGAGLGGGSSDAATTLKALNWLHGKPLSSSELAALGLQLGADVPFFISGQSAFVEGVGEVLSPCALPQASLLIIKPAQGVATREAYGHLALTRDTPEMARAATYDETALSALRNDMTSVAELIAPELSLALEIARSYSRDGWSRMSGSGSAVFALVDADTPLPKVGAGWFCAKAATLADHPMHLA